MYNNIINIIKKLLIKFLLKYGIRIKKISKEEFKYFYSSYNTDFMLTADDFSALSYENENLIQLINTYKNSDLQIMKHSSWGVDLKKRGFNLKYFRGDNVYVWQYRQYKYDANISLYLTYIDVKNKDKLNLLKKLKEDNSFGCWTFDYKEIGLLSRDLIDSINEINFLNKYIQIDIQENFKILDIGAGYGRLAHRFINSFQNVSIYDCADAIPESTYICDYYIKFRKVDHIARSLKITDLIKNVENYDLAINIHSFSECTYESVIWWLNYIKERNIKWLFIIPNEEDNLLTTELNKIKINYSEYIIKLGYQLIKCEPIIENDNIRNMIKIKDYFFLYKLIEEN